MSANQLTINHSKTEYIIIGSNRKLNQINMFSAIHIGGRSIDIFKTTKSLSINIDQTLSWKIQVDRITKKINAGFSILRQLCEIVDYGTLITIYQSIYNYTNSSLSVHLGPEVISMQDGTICLGPEVISMQLEVC